MSYILWFVFFFPEDLHLTELYLERKNIDIHMNYPYCITAVYVDFWDNKNEICYWSTSIRFNSECEEIRKHIDIARSHNIDTDGEYKGIIKFK